MNWFRIIIVNLVSKKPQMNTSSPVLLGRWKIDYCHKKINNKIDLSNEDHCGPCGQNIYKKKKIDQN
jgi:hypothetical protein